MGGHTARVTCMSWCSGALASGSRDRGILLRDPRDEAPFHTCLSGHRSEICGLSWAPDTRHLASGGNDNTLCVWDARGAAGAAGAAGVASPPAAATPRFRTATTPVHRWREHEAAVKALAWSPHSHGVLASGGGSAEGAARPGSANPPAQAPEHRAPGHSPGSRLPRDRQRPGGPRTARTLLPRAEQISGPAPEPPGPADGELWSYCGG